MHVTLTFNLPEERDALMDALRGTEWKLALWELDCWLRDKLKYSPDPDPVLETARDELYSILTSRDLTLE